MYNTVREHKGSYRQIATDIEMYVCNSHWQKYEPINRYKLWNVCL